MQATKASNPRHTRHHKQGPTTLQTIKIQVTKDSNLRHARQPTQGPTGPPISEFSIFLTAYIIYFLPEGETEWEEEKVEGCKQKKCKQPRIRTLDTQDNTSKAQPLCQYQDSIFFLQHILFIFGGGVSTDTMPHPPLRVNLEQVAWTVFHLLIRKFALHLIN